MTGDKPIVDNFAITINGRSSREINNLDGRGIDVSVQEWANDKLRSMCAPYSMAGAAKNARAAVFEVEYTIGGGEGTRYLITIKANPDPTLCKVVIVKETICGGGAMEILFTTDQDLIKKQWPQRYANRVEHPFNWAAYPELGFFDQQWIPPSLRAEYEEIVQGDWKDVMSVPAGQQASAVGDRGGCLIWSIGSSANGPAPTIAESFNKKTPPVGLSLFNPTLDGGNLSTQYKQVSHAYDFSAFWRATLRASCPFDQAPSCWGIQTQFIHVCGWQGTLYMGGGGYNTSLGLCENPCPDQGQWHFGGWSPTGEHCNESCVGRPCTECPGPGCTGPGCSGQPCATCPGEGCTGSCAGIPCIVCPGTDCTPCPGPDCETNCQGIPCLDCPGDGCVGPGCRGLPCVDCPGEGCTGGRCAGRPCSECSGDDCEPGGGGSLFCSNLYIAGPNVIQCGSYYDYQAICGGGGTCGSAQWNFNGVPQSTGTVNAPATNAGCAANGVLSVSCGGGGYSSISVSFNCVIADTTIATGTITGLVQCKFGGTTNVSCTGLPMGYRMGPNCGNLYSPYQWSLGNAVLGYDKYYCNGNFAGIQYGSDLYPPVYPTTGIGCITCIAPAHWEPCGPTVEVDIRNPDDILAGCCPEGS